jgi:hypothetical protein
MYRWPHIEKRKDYDTTVVCRNEIERQREVFKIVQRADWPTTYEIDAWVHISRDRNF